MAEGIGSALHSVLPRLLHDGEPRDASWGNDLVRRRTADVLGEATASSENLFHEFKHMCESPIECLALATLLTLFGSAEVVQSARSLKDRDDWTLAIVPQMRVYGYRLDFGILNRVNRGIVDLECDGFGYHFNHRKDCVRSLELWKRGILVFRVTGSSLCRNPLEALRPITKQVWGR